MENVAAFANADGGTLVLGIEDDGTVTGCPYQDAKNVETSCDVPAQRVANSRIATTRSKARAARAKARARESDHDDAEALSEVNLRTSDGRFRERGASFPKAILATRKPSVGEHDDRVCGLTTDRRRT